MGSPVTFLPTLSLLHPSILDLEPGTEQTDVQTDDGSQCIMPGPPYWGGGITSLPRGSFSLNLQEITYLCYTVASSSGSKLMTLALKWQRSRNLNTSFDEKWLSAAICTLYLGTVNCTLSAQIGIYVLDVICIVVVKNLTAAWNLREGTENLARWRHFAVHIIQTYHSTQVEPKAAIGSCRKPPPN